MAISIFKTITHYEKTAYGGQKHSLEYRQDHIAAANGLPATLGAVLDANGITVPAGYVRVFDSIANEGAGSVLS